MKIDPQQFETLVRWYTRFNKYFAIESFIIHAADDPSRVSGGVISNYSEVDVFGVKLPFSKEITGELKIEDDLKLQPLKESKIDILIGECKTGANTLNKIWTKQNSSAVSYLVRYAGALSSDKLISSATEQLLATYNYEDTSVRIRLVLFSVFADEHSKGKNQPLNITLDDILRFLLFIRGECWVDHKIGERSIHYQWPEIINRIFQIGNDVKLTSEEKLDKAKLLLAMKQQ